MLAALLLNLPDYPPPVQQNDADAGIAKKQRRKYLPEGPVTRDDVELAVAELEQQIESDSQIAPVVKKAKQYIAKPVLETREIADFSRELSMLEFEYRQKMLQADQQQRVQMLLVLEQITIILRLVQDDEEAMILLLLS